MIRRTPYRLYLLIDEYDNFANEILTDDEEVYHQLVKSDGPFKYLFKWVKGLMAGAGLDRLFITGVSPMVMSDVTSGMNIARNAYLKPALADLCGFTDREVDDLLAMVVDELGAGGVRPTGIRAAPRGRVPTPAPKGRKRLARGVSPGYGRTDLSTALKGRQRGGESAIIDLALATMLSRP